MRANAQGRTIGLIWRKGLGKSRAKSFTVRRIWDVGIANNVERFLYRTFGNGFPALLTLYIRKWTSVLWARVQLHRIRGWVVSFRPFAEINASVRYGRADNCRKGTRKLRAWTQLQDVMANAHVRIIRLIQRRETQAKNGFTVWIRFVS